VCCGHNDVAAATLVFARQRFALLRQHVRWKRRDALMTVMPCERCDDTGSVCEAYDDRPWDSGASDRPCTCGAPGMPCELCNPCGDPDDPSDISRMESGSASTASTARGTNGAKRVALLRNGHILGMLTKIDKSTSRQNWLKAIRHLMQSAIPSMRKDNPTAGINIKLKKTKAITLGSMTRSSSTGRAGRSGRNSASSSNSRFAAHLIWNEAVRNLGIARSLTKLVDCSRKGQQSPQGCVVQCDCDLDR
jgi:hypothetical protein